jgi:hypothetical protein
MDKVSGNKLKKGLSKIKKSLNNKIGAVWKLKKNEVVSKLEDLGYSYNEKKNELRINPSKAMTRKVNAVKI